VRQIVAGQQWHITGKVLAACVAAAIIAGAIAMASIIRHGLSARGEATLVETVIARSVRHFATPASMRNAQNPVPLNAQSLAEGRAHWADHCATCHGNDGSGQTEIGRGLYPKTPDMRQPRTQNLSDGELFSIIRNGVRLTGMPAWGDPAGHDDEENWKLVHFIRHLPKVTAEEAEEMEKMNPKSPEEWHQMQQERAFLAGGGASSTPASTSTTHSHHH
jgi:mono/diheme cytochrome c family protein